MGIFIIDFLLYAILIYSGYWYLIPVCIVYFIIIRTIQFYKKDIYKQECDQFAWIQGIQAHLDDPEWTKHMFADKSTWEIKKSSTFRNGSYALFIIPHTCPCQPCIIYSPDQQYTATIYHLYWRSYFFFQRHSFTIKYEN